MSDFDMPSFFSETHPRARKTHRCDECYNDIRPGEDYQRVVGVWCGDFAQFKICAACEWLRDWMRTEHDTESCFGGVYECLSEADLAKEIPPLVVLAIQATQ